MRSLPCIRQVVVLCCRNKKINLCVVREVRTRVVTVQLNKQITSHTANHATLKKQTCTFRSPFEHILLRVSSGSLFHSFIPTFLSYSSIFIKTYVFCPFIPNGA